MTLGCAVCQTRLDDEVYLGASGHPLTPKLLCAPCHQTQGFNWWTIDLVGDQWRPGVRQLEAGKYSGGRKLITGGVVKVFDEGSAERRYRLVSATAMSRSTPLKLSADAIPVAEVTPRDLIDRVTDRVADRRLDAAAIERCLDGWPVERGAISLIDAQTVLVDDEAETEVRVPVLRTDVTDGDLLAIYQTRLEQLTRTLDQMWRMEETLSDDGWFAMIVGFRLIKRLSRKPTATVDPLADGRWKISWRDQSTVTTPLEPITFHS